MRITTVVLVFFCLIIGGCSNEKNFDACVEKAQRRYERQFETIQDRNGYYNIAVRESLDRSRDAEVSACAQMYRN